MASAVPAWNYPTCAEHAENATPDDLGWRGILPEGTLAVRPQRHIAIAADDDPGHVDGEAVPLGTYASASI